MNEVKTAEESTAKKVLHSYVDSLSDDEALDLIDSINTMLDSDDLSDEERERVRRGSEEIERGEYYTWEQLRAKYDF